MSNSGIVFVLVWALAALAVRLAVVVVRREVTSHRQDPASMHRVAEDGTGTVRVSVVVVALLAIGVAVSITVDRFDGPYDQGELYQVASDVSRSYDEQVEAADVFDPASLPTQEEVRALVAQAGYDLDRVQVLRVAGPLEGAGGDDVRFQLVSSDARAWQCLEFSRVSAPNAADEDRFYSAFAGDWC